MTTTNEAKAPAQQVTVCERKTIEVPTISISQGMALEKESEL